LILLGGVHKLKISLQNACKYEFSYFFNNDLTRKNYYKIDNQYFKKYLRYSVLVNC
jgi:hypothetical protein